MTNKEIENNFTYHTPSADMPSKFEKLRSKAKELAFLINELVPNGREQSLAQTKLQEVIMWANAGIAIPKVKEEPESEPELPEFAKEVLQMGEWSLEKSEKLVKHYVEKGYRVYERKWNPGDNSTTIIFRRIK